MPNIKLRDGSGVETTYNNVDTITVPLADGSGTYTFGLTDEELHWKGNIPFLFSKNVWREKWGEPDNISRIVTNPIRGVSNILYGWTRSDYDNGIMPDFSNNIELVVDSDNLPRELANVFGGFLERIYNESNLPVEALIPVRIISLNDNLEGLNSTNIFFQKWYGIRSIPTWIKDFGMKPVQARPSLTWYQWCADCYNLRSLDVANDLPECFRYSFSGSAPNYQNFCYNTPLLRSITNMPVIGKQGYNLTSNTFSQGFQKIGSLRHLTFETDNGEPIVANWKSQAIDLTICVGYGHFNWIGWYYEKIGENKTQEYLDIKGRYFNKTNGYKGWDPTTDIIDPDDDYLTIFYSDTRTYDGKAIQMNLGFSHYTHDSAVETINSLPDTSAYLATAGGTNTIKFKYYAGCFTDEGCCGDLTEQEIAVAVAKGWTVAFDTNYNQQY